MTNPDSTLEQELGAILDYFMYNATPVNLKYLKGKAEATQALTTLFTQYVEVAKVEALNTILRNDRAIFRYNNFTEPKYDFEDVVLPVSIFTDMGAILPKFREESTK